MKKDKMMESRNAVDLVCWDEKRMKLKCIVLSPRTPKGKLCIMADRNGDAVNADKAQQIDK